jgi:hypothetical protein
VLYPEQVVEYPDPFELEEGLYGRIEGSEELQRALNFLQSMPVRGCEFPGDTGRLYQCWLSTADGTKVGGYPDWVQDPEYPSCSCGTTMDLLVMFSSWEFDAATWGRWLPIEERDVLTAKGHKRVNDVQSPANWMFGDAGNMYIFTCRACEPRPIRCLMQCS